MMDADTFTRAFLGTYFLLIGLHYTSTSLGLSSRTGISHIHYGARFSATWWYRHLFNLFRASILGICLARIAFPIDPWLGVFTPLYQPAVLLTGVVLLLVSFCVIDYVHAYMHQDWRTGINPDSNSTLLTEGPFGWSRNPLFIGILTGQIGLFLALPSWFTLVCLIVGTLVIILQARAEERTLRQRHGDSYTHYARRVRRWF